MLPEINSPEWDKMVAFMRINIETDFAYSKLESTVRELLEGQGRDFDSEFKKWLKKGEEVVI